MESRSERPRPVWQWLALAFVFSLAAVMAISCSPRIIERVSIQRDTLYQERRDSVVVHDRDSIFIREKGDTIYQYIERWRYRDRVVHDTIVRTKVDSVAVEREKMVKVEKPLSWWQRVKLGLFWWLAGAVAGLLAWTFRKRIAAFLTLLK